MDFLMLLKLFCTPKNQQSFSSESVVTSLENQFFASWLKNEKHDIFGPKKDRDRRQIEGKTDVEVNSEFIGFPENRHQLAIVMGDKDGPYITRGCGWEGRPARRRERGIEIKSEKDIEYFKAKKYRNNGKK